MRGTHGRFLGFGSIGNSIALHPIDASIFVVALIWMLFFAWLDHRCLKNGAHNDMKSVIVSIGVLGMQNVLNGVSMAVGVMEKALYSSYTHIH